MARITRAGTLVIINLLALCRKPVKLDVKAAEVARKIWEVLRIRTFQIIILQVGSA